MTLLIFGMLIFMLAHTLPMFPQRRNALVTRFGENGYKGLYSLVALAGLGLIIWGMRGVPFVHVYLPPVWGRHLTMLLMLAGIFCLGASHAPSNIKRFTAHPMLWGVTLWALGHLLANGDLASLILFGGFGAYALIDMVSANKRGAKPLGDKVPWSKDAKLLAISVVIYIALVFSHRWIAGVPLVA